VVSPTTKLIPEAWWGLYLAAGLYSRQAAGRWVITM